MRVLFVALLLLCLTACQVLKPAPEPVPAPPPKPAKPAPAAPRPAAPPAETKTTPAPTPPSATVAAPVSAPPAVVKRSAETELKDGITAYTNADYPAASKLLQSALALKLARPDDRIQAYKYLAFIACAGGQQASCRNYFRKALKISPRFELSEAEAGHPLWGPIFKEVKQKPTH